MQFDLSDEQKLLFDTVQRLLRDADAKSGPVERLNSALYASSPIWLRLSELGLTGLLVSNERGGLGDELLTLAVIADALGYAGAGTPAIPQVLAAWLLASSDLYQGLLDRVLANESLAAFAMLEAPNRWRPEQWQLAGATLSGVKLHVIGGADADLFIVGLAGGELAVVDAKAHGVAVEPMSSLDGTRPIATIRFANVASRILALPSAASSRLHDALLVLDAADAFGAARRALDIAVDYSKTRQQFGRPIGAFQAIKHQLANMAVDVEPCRALIWYAAHAWDRQFADCSRTAALTNAHVTEVAVKTARTATEVHGGLGFTWEYPLHVWLKRAIVDHVHLGTPIEQRARVATLSGW
jgi:alkylation response protein AidB-like acyl-CoA dehydrogenase